MEVVSAEAANNVKPGCSTCKNSNEYETSIREVTSAKLQVNNSISPEKTLTAAVPNTIKGYEDEVVRLVNVQRAKKGLQRLKSNSEIARVARYKSQDMINKRYFSHISPTYGSPFKMMESFGIRFSAAGENIAYGQKTSAAVMNAWMNSPGHRANILSPSYKNIGVGLAKNKNGVCYWTQMFTKPLK